MRIAISSKGKDLDSEVSDVFGRCPYFIIVENNDFETLENKSINQVGGAGISAAQSIAEKKVDAVITGELGPRAADVLKQFKIKSFKAKGTIKEAINKFKKGELEEF